MESSLKDEVEAGRSLLCKTRENSNFLKKGKMVISVKIRNFSRFQMTKWTSPLELSRAKSSYHVEFYRIPRQSEISRFSRQQG